VGVRNPQSVDSHQRGTEDKYIRLQTVFQPNGSQQCQSTEWNFKWLQQLRTMTYWLISFILPCEGRDTELPLCQLPSLCRISSIMLLLLATIFDFFQFMLRCFCFFMYLPFFKLDSTKKIWLKLKSKQIDRCWKLKAKFAELMKMLQFIDMYFVHCIFAWNLCTDRRCNPEHHSIIIGFCN